MTKKISQRIDRLKECMVSHEISGYMVPSSDEFSNEYTPNHLKRLEYITGFTGSNGAAFIMQNTKHALFTDSRYTLQAGIQLSQDFDVIELGDNAGTEQFFQKLEGAQIGYDPMVHTKKKIKHYQGHENKYNFTLKAIDGNLTDKIRNFECIDTEVFRLDTKYAGQESSDKINQVCKKMAKESDCLFLNNLSSICWLLNIRGADICYTPHVLAYLILSKSNKTISLFTSTKHKHLESDKIKIYPLDAIKKYITDNICNHGLKIQLDPTTANMWLYLQIPSNQIVESTDPCTTLKACKNNTEVRGMKEAHIEDGIALCKFLCWLETNDVGSVDEILASQKLLECRQERKLFYSPSFESISAYGPNGAIIHYAPTKRSNIAIKDDSLYLIDSGGQYKNGTTDVTRTVSLSSSPKNILKRHFTIVLKAHIALASAKINKNTHAKTLDSIARNELLKYDMDYAHSTGHGVGHFSGVHESPPSISGKSLDLLQKNMIFSNEPGFYKDGEYGIRIESLVVVNQSHEDDNLLEFETITMAPIDKKLIDFDLLTHGEKKWLADYHDKVFKTISQYLTDYEASWLKKATILQRCPS